MNTSKDFVKIISFTARYGPLLNKYSNFFSFDNLLTSTGEYNCYYYYHLNSYNI